VWVKVNTEEGKEDKTQGKHRGVLRGKKNWGKQVFLSQGAAMLGHTGASKETTLSCLHFYRDK
jgi:hypothetical protein